MTSQMPEIIALICLVQTVNLILFLPIFNLIDFAISWWILLRFWPRPNIEYKHSFFRQSLEFPCFCKLPYKGHQFYVKNLIAIKIWTLCPKWAVFQTIKCMESDQNRSPGHILYNTCSSHLIFSFYGFPSVHCFYWPWIICLTPNCFEKPAAWQMVDQYYRACQKVSLFKAQVSHKLS